MRRVWVTAVVLGIASVWGQQGTAQNTQRELGVNAQPKYAQSQESQKRVEVPAEPPESQEQVEASQPTLVGCLTQESEGRQFLLVEQKTGARYRLNGPSEELNKHMNHFVELVGRPMQNGGGAVAAGGEPTYEVRGVQDLAPTCGAGRKR